MNHEEPRTKEPAFIGVRHSAPAEVCVTPAWPLVAMIELTVTARVIFSSAVRLALHVIRETQIVGKESFAQLLHTICFTVFWCVQCIRVTTKIHCVNSHCRLLRDCLFSYSIRPVLGFNDCLHVYLSNVDIKPCVTSQWCGHFFSHSCVLLSFCCFLVPFFSFAWFSFLLFLLYMLCVNMLVSSGAYAPWVLPVTLYHGLFSGCSLMMCVWRINFIWFDVICHCIVLNKCLCVADV